MINQEAALNDGVPSDEVLSCEQTCLAKLKAEIQNDPDGRGYAGKTNEEIAELVNSPYSVTVSEQVTVPLKQAIESELKNLNASNVAYIIKGDGSVVCDPLFKETLEEIVTIAQSKTTITTEKVIEKDARISEISSGVSYTNNIVTAEDVESALNL